MRGTGDGSGDGAVVEPSDRKKYPQYVPATSQNPAQGSELSKQCFPIPRLPFPLRDSYLFCLLFSSLVELMLTSLVHLVPGYGGRRMRKNLLRRTIYMTGALRVTMASYAMSPFRIQPPPSCAAHSIQQARTKENPLENCTVGLDVQSPELRWSILRLGLESESWYWLPRELSP